MNVCRCFKLAIEVEVCFFFGLTGNGKGLLESVSLIEVCKNESFYKKEIDVKIICFENIFVNSEKGKTNFCRFDGSLSLIITIHMCINCIDIKSNLLSTSIFLFTALITYTCNLHIYFCL